MKERFFYLPALAIFTSLQVFTAKADEQLTTVEPVGIQIVSKIHGDREDFANMIMPLNAQNPGTSVAFFVQSPNGGILEFDSDGSELDTFADSAGNTLLVERPDSFSMQGFHGFSKVSKDGTIAAIEVSGNGIPAKGSSHIVAKGVVALTMATEKKSARSEAGSLEKGQVFKAGDIEFTVKESGKPDFGDAAMEVSLSFSGEMAAIAAYRFIDAHGKSHEMEQSGYSSFGFGGKKQVTMELTLNEVVKEGSLEIDLWQDLKKVNVPFDLKFGVGFGE
ncbi:MAG: hypothetical protein AAGA58_16535 [Verrucomicrobiota bacterium]